MKVLKGGDRKKLPEERKASLLRATTMHEVEHLVSVYPSSFSLLDLLVPGKRITVYICFSDTALFYKLLIISRSFTYIYNYVTVVYV